MQKLYLKALMLLLFPLAIGMVPALGQTIVGTVSDDVTGETLFGVTIITNETKEGVASDVDGNYSLRLSKAGTYTLRISYVGYSTQTKTVTIAAGQKITLNIKMAEDVAKVEETVVVGYGVQRKRDLTGSISKLDGDELTDMPAPSFEAAIQGKAPGVQITTGSGLAGSPTVVRIRGLASISASGDPLYVIDGIPMTQDIALRGNSGGMNNNPLAFLNPEDIESIEILKDAAANAIYGARGANGVILITTKRASTPGWKFTFNTRVGISTPTSRPQMLNKDQYVQMLQEAWENDGNTGRAPLTGGLTWNQVDSMPGTNWVDETIGVGMKQMYNFGVAKGGKDVSFLANFTHDDNGTFIIGNNYVRSSIRLNLDANLAKNLKLRVNSSVSRGQNNRVDAAWSGGLGAAMSTALPIYPIKNADGSWFRGAGIGNNPVAQRENKIWRTLEKRFINGAGLDYTVAKGLTITAQGSYDYMDLNDDIWEGRLITNTNNAGQSIRNTVWVSNYNYTLSANYMKTIKEDHEIAVLVGHEYQRSYTQSSRVEAQDMRAPFYTEEMPTTATRTSNPADKWAFLGYFSRANYNYKKKYFLQAGLRADASSRFGANYRWGLFPSLSGAWVISDEAFLKQHKSISFLKLRAGYGRSGNSNNMPSNARFGLFSPPENQIQYNSQPTFYQTQIRNENFRWETSNNVDVGVEMGLFKDRLTVTLDLYSKKTNDVITYLFIPPSSGFTNYWENVGSITNRGIEFSFKSRNLVGKFKWNTDFNIARNVNEVSSLGVYSEDAVSGGTNDTRVIVGEPLGTNYLVRFSHIDEQSGLPVYLDKTGKETYKWDPADRVPVGNILPKAVGGITNNFSYKNFDFSFLFVFVLGNDIYESSAKRQNGVVTDWNMDTRIFDRWQSASDDAVYPRLTRNTQTYGSTTPWINTTQWLQDGSYLRLRNVTFGYSLSHAAAKRINVQSMRITLIATNLFLITRYTGMDPEVSRDTEPTQDNYNQTRNLAGTAISYLTPPQERTFSLAINVGF